MNKYVLGKTTADYVCSGCGAKRCKLWRAPMADGLKLLCCICAANQEGKNIRDIDSEGRWTSREDGVVKKIGNNDTIGKFIRAIPCEKNKDAWLCHGKIPQNAMDWWCSLSIIPEGRSMRELHAVS